MLSNALVDEKVPRRVGPGRGRSRRARGGGAITPAVASGVKGKVPETEKAVPDTQKTDPLQFLDHPSPSNSDGQGSNSLPQTASTGK